MAPITIEPVPASRRSGLKAEVLILFVLGSLVGYFSTFDIQGPLANRVKDWTDRPGVEPLSIALTLAHTGRFADPYGAPTGPSAHMGRVFPMYLAGVLLAVKSGVARAIALRLGAALFHGLELALLPLLSAAVFGEAEIGLAAALLAIVIPCYAITPLWDSSLDGLATIGFCLAVTRIDARSRLQMAGLGAFWGLLLLLSPTLAIPTGVWAFFAARKGRWPLGPIGLAFAMTLVVCLPWTIRNYRVLGGFVPIRDNFGLELQVSNNDGARPGIRQNAASLMKFHPSRNPEQRAEVRQRGELRYNQDKMQQAMAWILSHPNRFAVLTFQRVIEYWFPTTVDFPVATVGIWIVTLLSIPGMILAAVRRDRAASPLLWMLALAPLVYYIVESDPRYRTPLLWISLLFAGYALHAAIHWRGRSVPAR
ncbi:MAG TPA: hypothetical protein VEV17_10890 [Bryobacteraceae bacterium]|nr:hypothetical protein [Bryobacteraceae bacterium]